jgi:hypothetical protein
MTPRLWCLCDFKSSAEAAAVQTLRAVYLALASAKRLDCVRFTAALQVALK